MVIICMTFITIMPYNSKPVCLVFLPGTHTRQAVNHCIAVIVSRGEPERALQGTMNQ